MPRKRSTKAFFVREIPWKSRYVFPCTKTVDIIKVESISLIQVRRQMPLLLQQVENDPSWVLFEKPLKAFDNTVPNVIALLTGQKCVLKHFCT